MRLIRTDHFLWRCLGTLGIGYLLVHLLIAVLRFADQPFAQVFPMLIFALLCLVGIVVVWLIPSGS